MDTDTRVAIIVVVILLIAGVITSTLGEAQSPAPAELNPPAEVVSP